MGTQDVLEWMLAELEGHQLEVCKYPSHGGYVRGVVSVNCEWYSQFCASYTRSRRRYPKVRTYIKRQGTIRALRRMLSGDYRGVYAERLLEQVQEIKNAAMAVPT